MKEILISIRNSVIRTLYRFIAKPLFFKMDPEHVHDATVRMGRLLGSNIITRLLTQALFGYKNKALIQQVSGITFKNPVGLAAGFDKNARLTNIMPHVGFGFEEVGSITGEYCEGNPGKHLWRLPKSKSLVVYYGLKNDGCIAIAKRLKKKQFGLPIGISIAKTNCQATVDTSEGVADYVKAYKAFEYIGDYYTINVSCPNVYGGQPFHDKASLTALLGALARERKTKPIFIKISPDLSKEQVDAVIDVSRTYDIDGFIISNLTKPRSNAKISDERVPEKGGLSGKVVEHLSNAMISYIYKQTKGEFVIIGCGGVFTAEDAYEKIKRGASLIQLITGMIYNGPQTIAEINQGLTKLLKKDGHKNIQEAVGTIHS